MLQVKRWARTRTGGLAVAARLGAVLVEAVVGAEGAGVEDGVEPMAQLHLRLKPLLHRPLNHSTGKSQELYMY